MLLYWCQLSAVVFAIIGYVNSQSNPCDSSRPGSCIPITKCPYALNLIKTPVTEQNRSLVIKLQCGWENSTPKVCCPPDKHANYRLFDQANCGELPFTDKIVGGNKSELFEFPWMALLGYGSGPKFKWLCGGTLINERYVLTAAHCINHRLSRIRLGEHDLSKEKDCQLTEDGDEECSDHYQDFNIGQENVITHKDFPPLSTRNPKIINDIALIRLPSAAMLSRSVKPICLPFDPALAGKKYEKEWTIAGWGKTENGTGSDILLKALIPSRTTTQCASIYSSDGSKVLISEDYHICAGGLTKSDSCNGDSGGPLKVINNFQYVQIGIVSFGPKECASNLPGVYTNLGNYVEWILDNVKP